MDVTSNEVICAPPDELPEHPLEQSTQDNPHGQSTVHFDVTVYIGGSLQYYAGELDYKLPNDSDDDDSGFPVFEVSVAVVATAAVIVVAAVIGRDCISDSILELLLELVFKFLRMWVMAKLIRVEIQTILHCSPEENFKGTVIVQIAVDTTL